MNQLVKTYSITEIVSAIKGQLEGEFFNITIQGEVTNFSASSAGHYYFNLSDEQASISCALFRGDALRNPLIRRLKNGDKIMASGSVSVYIKRGTFQLIAKKISLFGKGDLKAQYELLKKKLSSEGLFDLELKKDVPKYPKKIAVITALGGAAVQDFLNIMKRRAFDYHITIIPALMQGDGCAESVRKALVLAQNLEGVDLIVLTRGGGAMEDLWGFNDEKLVRDIYACKLPVISAIGHQIDYTLCDFVSDLRCETPSSAAEIISSEQVDVRKNIQNLGRRLRSSSIEIKNQVDKIVLGLNPKHRMEHLRKLIESSKMRLYKLSPANKVDLIGLHQYQQDLDDLANRITLVMNKKINDLEKRVDIQHSILDSLSPYKVLSRGYSIVTSDEQTVLTSTKDYDKLENNTVLNIQFKDGKRKVLKREER